MVGRIHVMARTFATFWVIIFVALAPAAAQEPAPLSPPTLDETAHLQILATRFRNLALIYDGEDAFDWRHDLDLQRLTSLTWEVHRTLLTKAMLHTIHAKLHPTYIEKRQELDQVRAAADRHAQLDLQELSDHVANLEIQLSITEQDLDLQDDVTSMLTRDIERHIAHRQAGGPLPDHIRAYHGTLNLLLADIL